MPKRDRSKQINLDFAKYEKAFDIYDNLPELVNKTAWVSDAIIEKDSRGKYNITREEVNIIVNNFNVRLTASSALIESVIKRIEKIESKLKWNGVE